MKPRIRKDPFKTKGFTCRSKCINGIRWVIGTGDTEAEAYADWAKKHRAWAVLPLIDTRDLYPKTFTESVYRRTLGPVARFFRSLTHRRDGTKR